MTHNQKALRGMLPAMYLKPKARRRCESKNRPGYQQTFLAKQERNLAAAILRIRARETAAAKARKADQ